MNESLPMPPAKRLPRETGPDSLKAVVRTRIHFCLAIIISALLTLEGCSTPSREPGYQGRGLTDWLKDYSRTQYANDPGPWIPPSPWTDEDRAVRARAEEAIRQIGTNALPLLLKMLASKNELKGYGPLAPLGFQVLGPTAKPTVPALIAM